jgi:hypothetical protein
MRRGRLDPCLVRLSHNRDRHRSRQPVTTLLDYQVLVFATYAMIMNRLSRSGSASPSTSSGVVRRFEVVANAGTAMRLPMIRRELYQPSAALHIHR